MRDFFLKILQSIRYLRKIAHELFLDLYIYYTSPYPFFLIIGAFTRAKRRLKILWLAKSPGRPPTPENIVDLILDMKRSNVHRLCAPHCSSKEVC